MIARLAHRLAAGALGALAGCGAPAHEAGLAAGKGAPAQAPLVAVVVLDQIGWWVLERHLEQLPPGGAIRSAIARGAWHHRVAYEHAATLTAPGHAAIFTGAPPAESGVGANPRIVVGRGRTSIVDDGEHAVLGNDKAFASPSLLRAEGVVDVLERRTGGAAPTLSISIKDRSRHCRRQSRSRLLQCGHPRRDSMRTANIAALVGVEMREVRVALRLAATQTWAPAALASAWLASCPDSGVIAREGR